MTNDFTHWLASSISESPNIWLFLLFRVDGTITNGHNLRQSVWSQSSISVIEKVKTALSWTITESRRKYNRHMKFAGYLGGEPDSGIFPHIHAVIELPIHTSQETLTEYLDYLWQRKLEKSFKQPIRSSVTSEVLKNGDGALGYCSRYEGHTFSFGDEKVIVNNSFYI